MTFPKPRTSRGRLHFCQSLSVLCVCKEIAETQETVKHRCLCGSQFWLLEGPESMAPVSWSGCPTASQDSTEADREMGMCPEESWDKQEGPDSLL